MKKTLWEELMGTTFTDENDHELIEWLDEQGIHVEYNNRANDLFFVRLYIACWNPFEGVVEPIDLKGTCAILRDLSQSNGQIYDVTFRFHNGYDLAYTFDGNRCDEPEIFITGGKCVTDAPVMQFVTSEEELSVIDALELVPKNAHLVTGCETAMLADSYLEKIRGYEAEPLWWQEFYDTKDWNVAKKNIEQEREELRQKYS